MYNKKNKQQKLANLVTAMAKKSCDHKHAKVIKKYDNFYHYYDFWVICDTCDCRYEIEESTYNIYARLAN